MKKLIKFAMIALACSMVTACATNSDVENLQVQVNDLDASVKQASADAASAQTICADATEKSIAAKNAADRAARFSRKANAKLGKKLRKSMLK
ncbi:MAG: Lpp/OprI family alanine-zipper lipoprotein [Methylobacter sp.]